jgi:hypothetical protein
LTKTSSGLFPEEVNNCNGISIMRTAILYESEKVNDATDTLRRLNKIALEHKGKCLSVNYDSIKQKLLWECEKGHKWRTTINSIVYSGSWCPECAGNRKLSLIELQHLAIKKGGMCLATHYINSKTRILWQCKQGHQWYASASSIKNRNSWCPVCAGNQPFGMDTMNKLAEKNQGKCLSTTYVNCKTKMLWKCKNGHQFQATPENVNQGKWCPHCRNTNV